MSNFHSMETPRVLQPSTKVHGRSNVKEVTPESSTPENNVPPDVFPNFSNISSVSISSTTGRPKTSHRGNSEKENQSGVVTDSSDINIPLNKLKVASLKNEMIFREQRENLEVISKQIDELREKLEKEKKEVHETLNALKEMSFIHQRKQIEIETEEMTANLDEHLLQQMDQIMNIVKHGKNKLELKNISFISNDNFKELLTEAENSMKVFNEGKDFETVQKVASILPALEESLEKCNESNKRCAEIAESIEKMLVHRTALKAIDEPFKS